MTVFKDTDRENTIHQQLEYVWCVTLQDEMLIHQPNGKYRIDAQISCRESYLIRVQKQKQAGESL